MDGRAIEQTLVSRPPQHGCSEVEMAQEFGPPAPGFHGSLWDILRGIAEEFPSNTALVSLFQPRNYLSGLSTPPEPHSAFPKASTWTYGRLMEASAVLARALFDLGVRAGDTFIVFLPNLVEWAILLWTCARLGVAYAPISPAFLERPHELRHILDALMPKAVLCDDTSFSQAIDAAIDRIPEASIPVRVALRASAPLERTWILLDDLFKVKRPFSAETHALTRADNIVQQASNRPAILLLTSGTTSLPKICPHSARNLHASTDGYKARRSHHSYTILGPLSHVQSMRVAIMIWRAGGVVCLPSQSFDAAQAIKALHPSTSSHLTCSPGMIQAMTAHPEFSASGYPHIQSMKLGADMISRDLVEVTEQAFRAQKVLVGWGMTETLGCIDFALNQSMTWHEESPSVGFVTPASAAKICRPGEQELMRRGESGELHVAGPCVIAGYQTQDKSEQGRSFYTDGKCDWFVTGDLALMDDSGAIYIKGRIKDLIIRGGENLSPVAMEGTINGVQGIQKAYVVGVEDSVTGQLPVAVIAQHDAGLERTTMEPRIQQTIVARFGQTHRLAHILLLQDLGLDKLPSTASGKIKKFQLRSAVEAFLCKQLSSTSDKSTTVTVVLGLWTKLLIGESKTIKQDTSITSMADSLLMLRFAYEVWANLGKRIVVSDVLEHDTPIAQARLLDGRASKKDEALQHSVSADAKFAAEGYHAELDETAMMAIERCLRTLGFSWEDVEAAYEPIEGMDLFFPPNSRPSACNLRWAFAINKSGMSVQKITDALERCVGRHAAARTILVPLTKQTFPFRSVHVVLRHSKAWLEKVFTVSSLDSGVESLAEELDQDFMSFGGPELPAFQACIVPPKDGGPFGLCINVCHALFDAMSIAPFFEDLEASIRNDPLQERVLTPYKTFANLYRNHREGRLGKRTTKHHIDKFLAPGITLPCLWPPLHSPGCFVGPDKGWRNPDGSLGDDSARRSLNVAAGLPRAWRIQFRADVPGIQAMKVRHAIQPATLLKAAVALFNVEQTGTNCAVFKTTYAGREWPFVEPWVAERLPHPLSIAGPCMAWTVDCIRTPHDQSVGAFLQGIQTAQELDSLYPHAPWRSIRGALDDSQRQLFDKLLPRQSFNWDSSTRTRLAKASTSQNSALKGLGRVGYIDVAVLWNFGLARDEEIAGFICYDDVHLSTVQAQEAWKRVMAISQWLVSENNWEERLDHRSDSI